MPSGRWKDYLLNQHQWRAHCDAAPQSRSSPKNEPDSHLSVCLLIRSPLYIYVCVCQGQRICGFLPEQAFSFLLLLYLFISLSLSLLRRAWWSRPIDGTLTPLWPGPRQLGGWQQVSLQQKRRRRRAEKEARETKRETLVIVFFTSTIPHFSSTFNFVRV